MSTSKFAVKLAIVTAAVASFVGVLLLAVRLLGGPAGFGAIICALVIILITMAWHDMDWSKRL